MASQKQLAQQAETLGYRNRASRAYHFDDSDRAKARRMRLLGRPPPEDPPCLVECGYCQERVMAVRRMYFDTPEQPHRHQPQGPKMKSRDEDFVNFKDKSGATP